MRLEARSRTHRSLLGHVSKTALSALLLMLLVSGLSAWATHSVVRSQERRLLHGRASEAGLVFTSSLESLTTGLVSLVAVLRLTGLDSAAFQRVTALATPVSPATAIPTVAAVSLQSGVFRVLLVKGPGLTVGQVLTGRRAAALARAGSVEPTSTGVMGAGTSRKLGFALRATDVPAARGELFVYRETDLGAVAAGRRAGSKAFPEVNVVLYASRQADPAQLLVATSGAALPAAGTLFVAQQAGADRWLLGVRAKKPLVGSVASRAWWVVAIGMTIAGLLLAAVIEFAARRRDAALALFAAEHALAETLQRSLLPSLPKLAGLDLAARYEAGGAGQQVGGDWFDVFPLPEGEVGFAIGDVMGHDLQAAAAMSQVRAALRAYANDGACPAEVLTRLDRFVQSFDVTALVSVVYGVLGRPAGNGSRTLSFANAGHLPPLLQGPDGTVTELEDGGSVVIGVSYAEVRGEATRRLLAGSSILLFTDGLLEAPDRSLAETIPALERTVAAHPPTAGSSALCDIVLATRPDQAQRDDIALLALRLLPIPGRVPA